MRSAALIPTILTPQPLSDTLCPEPGCCEELQLELAADVALDFIPIGREYDQLIAFGRSSVWHCFGCGYFRLAVRR